jgi:hypothetical protein
MIESFTHFHTVPNALIKLGMNVNFLAQHATVSSPSSLLRTITDSLAQLDLVSGSFTGLSVASSSLVWPGVVEFATTLDKIVEEFLYFDVVMLLSRHMSRCTLLFPHSAPAPTVL